MLLLLSSTTKTQRNTSQRAKKVVYNSTGLVDFAIVVVIFVLNLPNGQITEGLKSILLINKVFGAS